MRILQINCVYAQGSTGKIVEVLHRSIMDKGNESYVCYGRGAKTNEDRVYKTCGEFYSKCNNLRSRFTGVMYGGCRLSTLQLIHKIKKLTPDIVHIHCINGYFVNVYKFLAYLKKSGIPTVVTLHAEFMYTGNCGYALTCEKWKTGCGACPRKKQATKSLFVDNTAKSWQMMRKSFDGFQNIIITSVSPWLKNRAKQSPILKGLEHRVVLNGLNSDVFRYQYDPVLYAKMREGYKYTLLHVTPSFSLSKNDIKGGYYIDKLARQMSEDIRIIVVGRHDHITAVSPNIVFWGEVKDQNKLAMLYSNADLTLLVSKAETYSMVTAETLCCGTPIVGFQAGAPEQIAMEEYSCFVENGNVGELIKAVNEFLNEKYNKEMISKNAINRYSARNMCDEYLEIYRRLYDRKQLARRGKCSYI